MTLFRKICPEKPSNNRERKNIPYASGLEKKKKVAAESIKGKNYHLKYIPAHVRNELTFKSYYLLIGKSQSRWNQLIYNYRITIIQTKIINSFAKYNFFLKRLFLISLKLGKRHNTLLSQEILSHSQRLNFPQNKREVGLMNLQSKLPRKEYRCKVC